MPLLRKGERHNASRNNDSENKYTVHIEKENDYAYNNLSIPNIEITDDTEITEHDIGKYHNKMSTAKRGNNDLAEYRNNVIIKTQESEGWSTLPIAGCLKKLI